MANVTYFHQLALFICHLFIDGHFRTAHIFYKPNAFDYEFITHIDSICPEPMPLYLTDITQPWVWPSNQHDSPDNVLLLSFFEIDPMKLQNDVTEIKREGFALYQIFAFSSIDSVDERQRATVFRILHRFLPESSLLILNFNSENVSVYLNHSSTTELNQKPFFIVNQKPDFGRMNLFNRTFEENERMQSIIIYPLDYNTRFTLFHDEYMVNYYHLHLNNSCIETKNNLYATHHMTNYYKELNVNLKEMDDNTS